MAEFNLETLGIVAAILEIIGAWRVGNKHVSAFWFYLGGNALWLVYAFMREPICIGLLIISPVFVVLNFRAFRKWRKT